MLRKLTSLALCIILYVAAAVSPACAEETAPAERILKIRQAMEAGGDKAVWDLVNTHYATNPYREEGCADLYIWTPDGPSFPEHLTDETHLLNRVMIAFQETAGVGFTLEGVFGCFIDPDGTCALSENALSAPVHISPCGGYSMRQLTPSDGSDRCYILVAAGTDDNGHELEFYCVVQRLNTLREKADLIPENPDYDLGNIRYEAQFEVPVGDGVWWVPLRTLGGSRYTNRDIAAMVEHTPEQKQEEISTLYEALQLFIISDFTYTGDNVTIVENDIPWTHHKPGREAVRINTGCCAADTSWLQYILRGDYEMGFMGYGKLREDGHIFNYIYRDGYYYFIDLTGYEHEESIALETANTSYFWSSGKVRGNLLKARSPEDFARFYLGVEAVPPNFFEVYQRDEIYDVASIDGNGIRTFYYPEGADVCIIDGLEPEKTPVVFAPGPEQSFSWAYWQDAKYEVKAKYLRDPGATEPLTAYRPGDRLALEKYNGKQQAVIDGIKFATPKREDVRLGFEEELPLEGTALRGVYEYTITLSPHLEAIKDNNTLVLGELNLGILRTVPETQIVICTREGDELLVQEVLDGKYYDSRQISIRRDESGTWQETPDTWYLIITKEKKLKYEFGRFHCSIAEGN